MCLYQNIASGCTDSDMQCTYGIHITGYTNNLQIKTNTIGYNTRSFLKRNLNDNTIVCTRHYSLNTIIAIYSVIE